MKPPLTTQDYRVFVAPAIDGDGFDVGVQWINDLDACVFRVSKRGLSLLSAGHDWSSGEVALRVVDGWLSIMDVGMGRELCQLDWSSVLRAMAGAG